ncbi:hypothetical protein [Variovorax sp. JS1663]|uniref:hypothetical protein n=1 Tax=Variovorax sp. JS1663 TaxID=1851577 RepID=UPI000B346350|nr:hypothetical protein [Variovorax sp. JS1663]
MSTKAARREYLKAVGEFQRACREFSVGMTRVLEPPEKPEQDEAGWIVRALGSSNPPKRAPRVREAGVAEKKA